jgi:hypothetical protein
MKGAVMDKRVAAVGIVGLLVIVILAILKFIRDND